MPLPIPSLDNRTFAELAAEGQSLIPRFSSRWTDHNLHDPGITLRDLFAWRIEADIYQLDHPSDASYRAFLRLIGVEQRPAQLAETVLAFTASAGQSLPGGTRVTDKAKTIVFQTADELNVSPAKLAAVFTGAQTPSTDVTAANAPDGSFYFPFGREPQPGHALYLGFDQAFANAPETIALHCWTASPVEDRVTREKLIAEWKAASAELGEECVPYWAQHYSARTVWEYRAAGGGWAPLAGVVDETRALTLSGPVRFEAPADQEADGAAFFIRCRLIGGHYECPPELDAVALNAVLARHEEDIAEELLGKSNGRAGQTFEFRRQPPIAGSTALRVQLPSGADAPWREAPNWDLAGPHDRVYVLAPEVEGLAFADGRAARVPASGASLFCGYRVGGGPAGNILARRLELTGVPGLSVEQPFTAFGGAVAETLAGAQARAFEELSVPHRAVTLGDFEALALATPGVPVARARALAEHHPALPCVDAAGSVTVVVVPRCPDARPEPGPDFLRAVQRHLDRRRTLTTEVHVIGPGYTTVAVRARLNVAAGTDANAVREQARHALDEFFHPLRGGPGRTGWPVGRDVYRAEVMALLGALPGVEFVDQFGLSSAGDIEPRCGNLPVCPDHLLAAEPHEIEVAERSASS